MKFCANISFLFNEYSFCERYFAAKEVGFRAVESAFPNVDGSSLSEVVEAKKQSGLQHVLLNIYNGVYPQEDQHKKGNGCAATPGKEHEFADRLDFTIKLAKALDCPKIHLMAGLVDNKYDHSEQLRVFTRNMGYAAQRLGQENMIGLIEPICKYTLPEYFLDNYPDAINVIKEISSPNLKLLFDIFHCQQIQGNLTHSMESYYDHIGHIQIAQVPYRGEPSTPGELDYGYIFQYLDYRGYDGWIGLEYKPSTTVANSIQWMHNYGLQL